MRHLVTVLISTQLLVAPAAPVLAKSLSRIIADSGLSPEDFTLLKAAGRTLYDTASPRPGSAASWENPASGSRGDVRLKSFEAGCAELSHRAFPVDAAEPVTIRTKWCRSSDGKWLLSP